MAKKRPSWQIASAGARNPPRYHPVRSAIFENRLLLLDSANPSHRLFHRGQKLHALRYYNAAGRMSGPQLRAYIAQA